MDRLEEFDVLSGFKFLEAYEQVANCNDGTTENVTTLRFYNDKHVAIDVDVIDGEFHISEPYAITDDFKQLDD